MTEREQVIAGYLAATAARLTGPARARRDVLAELDAGLTDAADAHRAAGLDPAEAARAAVTEFGSPDRVAEGFRGELTAAQARRTALTVLATGPLIGALWVSAALAGGTGARPVAPWHWAGLPAGGRLAVHLAVIALAAAIASTLFTVATTGRLTRWLSARPPAFAAIAAGGTAPIDIALLTLLAIQPGRLAALPAALAAAASLARLTLVTRAAGNRLAGRVSGRTS